MIDLRMKMILDIYKIYEYVVLCICSSKKQKLKGSHDKRFYVLTNLY